jgi:peptide/nickel transport system permease protein
VTLTNAPVEQLELPEQLQLPAHVGSGGEIVRSMLRDRTARIGLVLVVAVVLSAVFAGVLAPHDPNAVDVAHRFASPSRHNPLGTDYLGRDVLSRVLFGGRLSIGSAVAAAAGTAIAGLVIGLVAGFFGGIVDTLITRVIDVILAFPLFLLALAITGILGIGLRNIILALIIASWAWYARIVRGAVLAEKNKAYIEAARTIGASNGRILFRHVLPNIVAPVIVWTTVDAGQLLLAISGLSFLGLGVKPPASEWGAMLAEGRSYLDHGLQMFFPGAAIFLTVLGLNLLGDGLRDALDPRTRRGRATAGRDAGGDAGGRPPRGVLRLFGRGAARIAP